MTRFLRNKLTGRFWNGSNFDGTKYEAKPIKRQDANRIKFVFDCTHVECVTSEDIAIELLPKRVWFACGSYPWLHHSTLMSLYKKGKATRGTAGPDVSRKWNWKIL